MNVVEIRHRRGDDCGRWNAAVELGLHHGLGAKNSDPAETQYLDLRCNGVDHINHRKRRAGLEFLPTKMTGNGRDRHECSAGKGQTVCQSAEYLRLLDTSVGSQIREKCWGIGVNGRHHERQASIGKKTDQSPGVEILCGGTNTPDQSNLHIAPHDGVVA